MAPEISAHDALASRSCAQPGCVFDAETGSEYCREHPRRKLQRGEVTEERLELARRVSELRARGLTQAEVAEDLQISRSYVGCLEDDPDGAKARDRKERYRLPCPRCGTLMSGSDGISGAPSLCATCAALAQHDERHWTREAIIESFQAFHARFGRPPSAGDTGMGLSPSQRGRFSPTRLAEMEEATDFGLPFPRVVVREFGSWNAGIVAAGFAVNRGGSPMRREHPFGPATREVLRILADGPQRYTEICRARGTEVWAQLNTLRDRGFVEQCGYGVWALTGVPFDDRAGGSTVARMFVVLSRNGVGWIERETVEALTDELAIEKVASEEGEYVAIEARHWQPLPVAPVTRLAVVKDAQTA